MVSTGAVLYSLQHFLSISKAHLDSMIVKIFSSLNDSVIVEQLFLYTHIPLPWSRELAEILALLPACALVMEAARLQPHGNGKGACAKECHHCFGIESLRPHPSS